MPPWRNWLARSAVNREVGGSSPPGGDFLTYFFQFLSAKRFQFLRPISISERFQLRHGLVGRLIFVGVKKIYVRRSSLELLHQVVKCTRG